MDQLIESGFNYWTLARTHRGNLVEIDIHAYDLVPQFREASRRNCPNITQPEDTD
jgi:hypothetical protein